MGNAEQVLVTILSVALAIFIILAIVAILKVIKLVDELKVISDKAKNVADKAGNLSELLVRTAGPAAMVKIIANTAGLVFKQKKNKGEKR